MSSQFVAASNWRRLALAARRHVCARRCCRRSAVCSAINATKPTTTAHTRTTRHGRGHMHARPRNSRAPRGRPAAMGGDQLIGALSQRAERARACTATQAPTRRTKTTTPLCRAPELSRHDGVPSTTQVAGRRDGAASPARRRGARSTALRFATSHARAPLIPCLNITPTWEV